MYFIFCILRQFFLKNKKQATSNQVRIATLLNVRKSAIVPINKTKIKNEFNNFELCTLNFELTMVIPMTKYPASTLGCENVAYGRIISCPLIEAFAIPGVVEENIRSPK